MSASLSVGTASPAGYIAVGIFHPGWVQTDMGGAEAPVTPAQSVTGLRARIKVDAFAEETLSGVVEDIAPLPDPSSFFSSDLILSGESPFLSDVINCDTSPETGLLESPLPEVLPVELVPQVGALPDTPPMGLLMMFLG